MAEDITASHKITFQKSLPMGTRGTFTHDGELWIAYPATKNQRLHAVTLRLLGILNAINTDMLQWINGNPQTADLVVAIVERVQRGQTLAKEIGIERAEASVS